MFLTCSPIYCHGDLLEAVQLAALFDDSKEFVDRPLKDDPDVILDAFQQMNGSFMDSQSLREFVYNWTDAVEGELLAWQPTDWIETLVNSMYVVQPLAKACTWE